MCHHLVGVQERSSVRGDAALTADAGFWRPSEPVNRPEESSMAPPLEEGVILEEAAVDVAIGASRDDCCEAATIDDDNVLLLLLLLFMLLLLLTERDVRAVDVREDGCRRG